MNSHYKLSWRIYFTWFKLYHATFVLHYSKYCGKIKVLRQEALRQEAHKRHDGICFAIYP